MIADTRASCPAGQEVSASSRSGDRLFRLGDRILRTVNSAGIADLNSFLDSPHAQAFIQAGRVVGTRRLSGAERDEVLHDCRVAKLLDAAPFDGLLEHERIAFPSFPYAWQRRCCSRPLN